MALIYESNEMTRIRLFSDEFVSKNKDKCHLIIEGTTIDLCSIYIFNKLGKHVVLIVNPKNDLTDMSHMFNQCEWLKSISENSKWKTDNVTDMNHLFSFCKRLSFILPLATFDTILLYPHCQIYPTGIQAKLKI